MEINIGSNICKNTNGILQVQGKQQIFLELGDRDNQLLLTMDVYDSNGEHIAKLKRNAWVFNNKDKFEITTQISELKLIDKESGDLVVEVKVVGKDKIEILNGKFYTHQGLLLEIKPEFWRLGNILKLSGSVADGCGSLLSIG